jgi:hypothetical protein
LWKYKWRSTIPSNKKEKTLKGELLFTPSHRLKQGGLHLRLESPVMDWDRYKMRCEFKPDSNSEFATVFLWGLCCSICSFLWSVLWIIVFFFLLSFLFGHCIICLSIYGFWLLLWYFQSFLGHILLDFQRVKPTSILNSTFYLTTKWNTILT